MPIKQAKSALPMPKFGIDRGFLLLITAQPSYHSSHASFSAHPFLPPHRSKPKSSANAMSMWNSISSTSISFAITRR